MKSKQIPPLFCVKNTLGSLEYEIMKIVWDDKRKLTVRDIVNLQKGKKYLAYTTIMTVIDHLYSKGFLNREKIKKTYYYSPVNEKNYIVGTSLSKILSDLNRDYGKRKILYLALSNSVPRFSIEIPPYTVPVLYGASFTFLVTLFSLSFYDLLQNANVFVIKDYLSFLTSDMNLFIGKLNLFILAFFESLPVADLLVIFISFAFVIVLAKKLAKLLDLKLSIVN